MTPSLPGSRIGEIFHNEIEPNLEAKVERARDEQRFVLVFVGGQPGAGKSRVVGLAAVEHRGAVIIDGGDLRKYHPDYDRLMREDPLRMPDVTAEASGQWVGMTAEYLRLRGAAAVLETTMRQPEVVASTARQFRESGYAIEARCLAIPPAVSRLGTLSRYVGQVQEFGAGRWTASQAHDAATTRMPLTVEALVDRGLVDQVIVQRRDGQVVFDRAFDPEAVMGESPTIVLHKEDHMKTRTYSGRNPWQRELNDSYRDVLERDYDDLRGMNLCFDLENSIEEYEDFLTREFPHLAREAS